MTFQRSCSRLFRINVVFAAFILCIGMMVAVGIAQTNPSPAQKQFTPEPLPPGWDQIDERLVFLTVRLSSIEASVAAVDKAIIATGYSKGLKADDAEHARRGNEIMNRNGGGPVPWQEFYGRTATDFYFHPGSSVQMHSHVGVGREADIKAQHIDTPVAINRPPQLDYIYRANSDNQKRAEQAAAELGGKIDKLVERRRSLESEQSALWSEIAFQAVASRDLSSKPLYRFNLKSTQQDQSNNHVAAAGAAYDFLRTINQLMDDTQKGVENDPGSVFHQFSVAVSSARKTLNDRLAEQESLALDLSDGQSKIGKVSAVAKRIDELAKNLDDSFRLAHDGDIAGDDQRKNTFRGQLQDGLLNTADTVVTADQCILDVVKDWKLTPDVKKPATQASLHLDIPAAGQNKVSQLAGRAAQPNRNDGGIELLPKIDLQDDVLSGNWKTDGGSLLGGNLTGRAEVILPYRPNEDYDLKIRVTRVEGDGSVEFYLPRDGQAAAFISFGPDCFGVTASSGKVPLQMTSQKYQPIQSGKLVEVIVRVRDGSVSFSIDGVQLMSDHHTFATINGGLLEQSGDRIAIGCWKCRCKIESCVVDVVKDIDATKASSSGDSKQVVVHANVEGATEYNGHLYKVVLEKKSWEDAEKSCEAVGGHLAIVKTDELRQLLASMKHGKVVWVGCSKVDGKWVWVDHSDGPPNDLKSSDYDFATFTVGADISSRTVDGKGGYNTMGGYICEWDEK